MGATGLAVKMVVINFITVNVMLYFNAKFLKLPFYWYLTHQLVSLFVFLTLAFLIIMPIVWYYYFVKNLKDIKKDPHFIYIIFVAVLEATPVLYMLLAFLIVIFFPN